MLVCDLLWDAQVDTPALSGLLDSPDQFSLAKQNVIWCNWLQYLSRNPTRESSKASSLLRG